MTRTWVNGNTVDAAAMNDLEGRMRRFVNVKDQPYNASGAGYPTDDTSAVQAAISAAAATGGVVFFPAGVYYCAGQLTIPDDNTGAWPKLTGNIALLGEVASDTGRAGPTSSSALSSRLDLRANTAPGMIWTRGVGRLEIANLTLSNEGTSTQPFVYTTGTSLQIHDCLFAGKSTKTGTSCDQDAIVCGGTTITEDATYNAPFQGYICRIENNTFTRIRRAVYGRTYFNANVVSSNWIHHDCGSNLAGGAPFELLGHSTQSCYGNVFFANQVEAIYYTYAFTSDYATGNQFIANSVYDTGGSFSHVYRFGAQAIYNFVLHGTGAAGSEVSEHASSANRTALLGSAQNQPWVLPGGLRIGGASGKSWVDNGVIGSNQRVYAPLVHLELGALGVANIASASESIGKATVFKLPIYDAAGNLKGYVPIYSSIS